MHLKRAYLPNGESVAYITLFGTNRDPRVREWHEKVMVDHWRVPVNYIQCPFETGVSHGACMNSVLSQIVDSPEAPTYVWWWDNDCVALDPAIFNHVLDTVKNKRTLWGQGWQSSHVAKPRGGNHPYASQACLCFSLDLHRALGRPTCDWTSRSDTAEELTWAVEERGFTLALQFPNHSETQTTELSQSCWYGRGNIYGPGLTYHESRADLEGATERFATMCQRVLDGGFKEVVPA